MISSELTGERGVDSHGEPERRGRRVVVTGGCGFIGRHLCRSLLRLSGDEVIAVDATSASVAAVSAVRAATLDLSDERAAQMLGALEPTHIVHLAGVTDTLADPNEILACNTSEFERVLGAAAATGARVVYASSAAVYGNGPWPMSEEQQPQPHNAYAASKLAMEQMAMEAVAQEAFSALGLRFFNVYGAGEAPKGRAASMVHQICAAVAKRSPVVLFDPGSQGRDFVYVEDVLAAVVRAIDVTASGVVNVGSGTMTTFNDLVATATMILGQTPVVNYVTPPPYYQQYTCAELRRASEWLGYEPAYDLDRGIRALASAEGWIPRRDTPA